MSLRSLIETGLGGRLHVSTPPGTVAGISDRKFDERHSSIVLQIARFLHRELPIRLARRAGIFTDIFGNDTYYTIREVMIFYPYYA